MMTNIPMMSIRKKLLSRKPCIGTWMQIGHPEVAEILASCGFDWIAVDMEHTDIRMETFVELTRAMSFAPVAPMARVTENSVMDIRGVLDAGAVSCFILIRAIVEGMQCMSS